ncbi:MAG: LPXTG cell wall anchor domain-containing protein, partial [Clostridia bacterium]|nr:LPXTG cell wall anchor domain-containing protein [Clostridia bacterium]
PTRPADDKYTYTFKGWSPAVTAASADCEYVAVYEATVPQIPQTGDSMNFVLTAALAAVGMIGMTVIIRKKKEA